MPITVIPRATLASQTDAATYSTGAFTPGQSALLVACYGAERVATEPSTPSVAGHSGAGAWTLIDSLYYITNLNTRRKLFLFACVTGGAPTTSQVSFSHGVTHLGSAASVFEVSGGDHSHGLTQTFVSFARSPVNPTAGTSLTITLPSPGHQDNRAFAMFMHTAGETTVPRVGWAEIHDIFHTVPAQNLETQWRQDMFEATASASWVASTIRAGVAFEIKALVASGPPAPVLSGTAGNGQNVLNWTSVT